MTSTVPESPQQHKQDGEGAIPQLKSIQDLLLVESWDTEKNQPKSVAFFYLTEDEKVFFGQSLKHKREISLDEYNSLLEPIQDQEIYPEVPSDTELTIAPDHWDDTSAYVKRPGLISYEEMKGTEYIPKNVLQETLIMEKISEKPHPNIIRYHGCHVRRGRITAIVLERLDKTLMQYISAPEFSDLDKTQFIEDLESVVEYLHSLGLAHNDINPYNIMIKDGRPVLIDFGSCQPFGSRLQSLGTAGWYEELFFTSEKKHDLYSLKKLREWIQNPTE